MPSTAGTHVGSFPHVVIFLQGPKRSEESQLDVGGSAVTLRVRRLEGLLSMAEAIPHGIVLVRAESFESPADLDTWRFAHPVDWETLLLLSAGAASYRASLEWLGHWPIPVFLDGGEGLFVGDGVGVWAHQFTPVRDSLRMMPYLTPRLESVPPKLGTKIITTYASPVWPRSLQQLSNECGKSERHVRRQLAALGIRSSYLFFSASRVLRSYRDVARAELALPHLSKRHGFGCSRSLRSQWLDVTGSDWKRAREAPLSDELLASVARRVLRP